MFGYCPCSNTVEVLTQLKLMIGRDKFLDGGKVDEIRYGTICCKYERMEALYDVV